MLSKNVKASLNSKEYCDSRKARMYEISDKKTCPVEAFHDYLSRFPNPKPDTPLFPKISKSGSFCNQVIGKCMLGDFMKNLSKQLRLSMIYTNHCIRVTVATVLKERSASDRDVMMVTGHKNSKSLERYDKKRRDKDIREISFKLSHDGNKSLVAKVNDSNVISDETARCPVIETTTPSPNKKAKFFTSWGLLEIDL